MTTIDKQYLLASDFDQTLRFHDSGIILSEMLGISGWPSSKIRALFEPQGFVLQEWERVRTDSLTISKTTSPQVVNA